MVKPKTIRPRKPSDGAASSLPTFVNLDNTGKFSTKDKNAVVTQSFLALADDNTVIPPDTNATVGITQCLTALNSQVRIQNRSGDVISTETFEQFWDAANFSPTLTNLSDPNSCYDPFSDRFMITTISDIGLVTSRILLAVSKTADLTSGWRYYQIFADGNGSNGTTWADNPKIGFNAQWIVVSANNFTNADDTFSHVALWVVDKTKAYDGTLVVYSDTTLLTDTEVDSIVPARTMDAKVNIMYLLDSSLNLNNIRISTITGVVGSPVFTLQTAKSSPNVATWNQGGDPYGYQLGDVRNIDTGDDRMLSVTYRNGYLWSANNIYFPSTTPTFASILFLQMNPNTGVCTQQSILNDGKNSTSYGFPSLSVNINMM